MEDEETDSMSISLLECSICNEKYSKNSAPRQLPCRHTYCHVCIQKLVDSAELADSAEENTCKVKCPDCREIHELPDGNVENFPKDLTMLKFLEEFNTKRKQKAALKTQKSEPKHLPSKPPHGAPTKDTQELLSKLKISMKDVDKSGKIFDDSLDKIRSERAQLSDTMETTKNSIRSVLREFVNAANRRKEQLLTKLNKAYEESFAMLTAQEEEYKKDKQKHEEFCSNVNSKLEEYGKTGQFPGEELQRLIQKAQNEDRHLQHQVPMITSKKLVFVDGNGEQIISDIISWGNIQHELSTTKIISPMNPNTGPDVLISDQDQGNFRHYTLKDAAIHTLGLEPGAVLSSPSCVTELANGDIAVASTMSYEISIFSSSKHKKNIRLNVPRVETFNDGITGMCMIPTGRLCVSNPDTHSLQILTLDGLTQLHYQVPTTNREEEFAPWGVACAPNGELYVCDWANHLVRVLNQSGEEIRKFGGRGKVAGKFNRPSGVALMEDGEVVVADFLNDRIQVFDGKTGVYLRTFGQPGSAHGQLKGPMGIAVDSKGFIAVSEGLNNRVQLFTSSGRSFKILPRSEQEANQLNTPRGIAITRNNDIAVCDNRNDRVLIF